MTASSALIADDEPLLRRELRDALADLWPDLSIVDECGDGAAALRSIEERHPAISFLDIRMPKLSGLEVAERVQGATQVVFVTAYDEHAVAAFEKGAADYVLKPVRRARLSATIRRLKERLAASPSVREVGRPWFRWIQATSGNTVRFFAIEDICYFRSDGKYTRVVVADGEGLIRKSLALLLQDLDPAVFWQINRGIVVNVEHVDKAVRQDSGDLIVKVRRRDIELPVSRAHHGRFRGM